MLCNGCLYANVKRELEGKLTSKCPFCRFIFESESEMNKKLKERLAKMNDPILLRNVGLRNRDKGDHETEFKYLSRAAEMGDAVAHHELYCKYTVGRGVEKNVSKAMRHLEQAAIGGHALARAELGNIELRYIGRIDRAVKHWMIAASHGDDASLKELKSLYERRLITKDDYVSSLRAHHAAVDATKSEHRKEAESVL